MKRPGVDVLPFVVSCLVSCVLLYMAWQVNEVIDATQQLHEERALVVGSIAADEAAFAAVAADLATGKQRMFATESGPDCLVLRSSEAEGGKLQIHVVSEHHADLRFACDFLSGSGPLCLSHPLSLPAALWKDSPGLQEWLAAQEQQVHLLESEQDFPSLFDLLDLSSPAQGMRWPGLKEDGAIALLRLPEGTDGRDYVPQVNAAGICPLDLPGDGILVLPGHLWLPEGDRPLILELRRPLTVLVQGNIYLGRSLQVRGPGKLTLVAVSGEWSASVEGAGAIHLGLPSSAASEEAAPGLQVDASLVAQGAVHLQNGPVRVDGALVAKLGMHRRAQSQLQLTGLRLFLAQREIPPGFRSQGSPRPGLLQRIDP